MDIQYLGQELLSIPEVQYNRITNLDVRLKAAFISGDRLSEYGEGQGDYRLEFRMRYYF